ncbi:hypothetical protein LTR85_001082 [Meristemomyces frigidus]|nr:hypothetical protein LTR85_001082 [Meristemomyces frigidus]
MEFRKSCRTNVQIAENVLETPYKVFEGNERTNLHAVLAELRERDVLCAADRLRLWVFGLIAEEATDLLDDKGLAPVPGQEPYSTLASDSVKKVLLEALKGALSYKLGVACGALRIDSWTWLFPAQDVADRRLLLRFNLHVTDTGSLYATTTTEWCHLTTLDTDQVRDGEVVKVVPCGSEAQLLRNGSQADTTMFDGEVWQARVETMLRGQGIELPDDTDWVHVRLSDATEGDQVHLDIMWPACLCLTKASPPTALFALGNEADRWKQWFTTEDDPHRYRNPLAVAEEWYLGTVARENAANQQSSEEVHEDGNTIPASTSMDLDPTLEASPLFVQRIADQQAAMNGIYPTPEDNLMGGPPTSQPPSSTADHAMMAVMAHSEGPGGLNSEMLPDHDDGDQNRGHSSSSDPSAFPPSADDLFGDMGGMDFGGGEVGDADFDFFNEEDGEDASAEVSYEDMPGLAEEPLHSVDPPEQPLVPIDDRSTSDQAAVDEKPPAPIRSSPTSRPDGKGDPTDRNMVTQPASPELEKPLTPLTIKEQLLPPPIPASTTSAVENMSLSHRRSSTFDPVVFKEGLDFRRYSIPYGPVAAKGQASIHENMVPNISLPPKHKKPRPKLVDHDNEDGEPELETSMSEEDSYESASSVSESDLPPKLPWDKKKRKRGDTDGTFANQALLHGEGDLLSEQTDTYDEAEMVVVLDLLVEGDPSVSTAKPPWKHDAKASEPLHPESNDKLPTVEECFFSMGANADVDYIAQLASEQAVSCTPAIVQALDILAVQISDPPSCAEAVLKMSDHVLQLILPSFEQGEISKLALVREPPTGRAPLSTPNSAVRATGQPRPPPHRAESMAVGTADIFSLPTPFIRVQRGPDTYEMSASVLAFWNEMSLAPASGPKDIRAFCVLPNNEDLRGLAEGFMREIGSAYENCKLGSHVHVRDVDDEDELDDYEDGLMPVQCDEGEENSVKGAIWAFRRACPGLGDFLAQRISHQEPEKTIVVYMVNPFPDELAAQHLCACFWAMYKSYRDSVSKAKQKVPRSDIVLQIIPIELIASSADAMVVLNSKQLAALAKEVYNRCPPSDADAVDPTSVLPNYAAPFVELASPPPKRLNFQLTAEPPSDLLHEGSALHLAYAISADKQFMNAAWVDSTGRHQFSMVYGMRGRSFGQVAEDVWACTWDTMVARDVSWRIFIVTVGEVHESYRRCWKKIIGSRRRKQPFSVTLLSGEPNPELELSPSAPVGDDAAGGFGAPGAGFLTPASTPQGTSMTVSPDTSGFAAPLTPAPSETAATITENDPDALVIELAEESWAVLFSPTYSSTLSRQDALATGALFKRGHAGLEPGKPGAQLPCLAASLLWTVQVRPNGNVDEGNVRQAEMTLREVLRMWRNLSILTKARGLGSSGGNGGEDILPLHLVAAWKGAEGLDGFLQPAA